MGDSVIEFIDAQGFIYQISTSGEIRMFLERFKTWKLIGQVKKDCLYKSLDKDKHFFKKMNAWGLGFELLVYLQKNYKLKFVEIKSGNCVYKVGVDTLIKDGQFLHFQKQGFEKQIFLDINKWEITKRGI